MKRFTEKGLKYNTTRRLITFSSFGTLKKKFPHNSSCRKQLFSIVTIEAKPDKRHTLVISYFEATEFRQL